MLLAVALPPFQASPARHVPMKAVPVRVAGAPGRYRLLRGGKPMFVKGAGGGNLVALLPKFGANAARTWGTEHAMEDLEACRKAGVTLLMGIWLPHKSDAPDYGDPAAIERMRASVREAVRVGKDHPNLLAYGLGNEMESGGREADPKLWGTINELAKMVHALDPNHPVVTVVAELAPGKVEAIRRYAPEVDILGVNSYGGAPTVPQRLKAQGWTKPYLVTEFGPLGPWEGGKSPWGAAYEATSTEKARHYAESYQRAVLAAPGDCLGSFAFLWGDKQEETATWFGMFLPGTREPVESAETMRALWRGQPLPKGRIESFGLLDGMGQAATEFAPGANILVMFAPLDVAKPMALTLAIRGETAVKATMGAGEITRPILSTVEVPSLAGTRAVGLKAPTEPGTYRVYLVARDGSGFAATANAPLQVR